MQQINKDQKTSPSKMLKKKD